MFVIGVYEPRGATPEPAARTVDRQFDRSFSNQPHFGVQMVVYGVRRSARRQRRQLCGFRHMHAERSCHGGNQLRGHDREPTIFHDQISVGFKVGQAREPTISLCDKQGVTFNQGRTPSTLRGYPHDQDVGCRWDVIQSRPTELCAQYPPRKIFITELASEARIRVPDTFQLGAISPCSAFLACRKINKLN